MRDLQSTLCSMVANSGFRPTLSQRKSAERLWTGPIIEKLRDYEGEPKRRSISISSGRVAMPIEGTGPSTSMTMLSTR